MILKPNYKISNTTEFCQLLQIVDICTKFAACIMQHLERLNKLITINIIAFNHLSNLETKTVPKNLFQKVLCRCAATLLQNISIACTIEFKNIILSLMVKFWSVIKWENWILHFAANFCNLQQLCCMLLALLKMQKHGFKKFVLRNLFYV